MSTKKVLICGGDSYTYPRPAWPGWPDHLCDMGQFDSFINVSMPGAGNDWIFNKVYDKINEYSCDPNNEITVVVLWSDVQRLNFFDTTCRQLTPEYYLIQEISSLNIGRLKNMDDCPEELSELSQIVMDACRRRLDDPEQMYSNILTHAYRRMYLLEDYCKKMKIKYYSGCIFTMLNGDNIIRNIDRSFEVEDVIRLNPNNCPIRKGYKKDLEDSKSFMGFDFTVSDYIIQEGLNISKENTHPNAEGCKAIATLIHKFMNDGIRPELKNPIWKKGEDNYVYD